MLKKIPSNKLNGVKMPSFFFHEFQLIKVLLLIRDFYMSTRFATLKLFVRFCIFDSIFDLSFYKSLYFCSTKSMDSLYFKTL